MPSRICCPDEHSTKGISIHEAAVALSEQRALGVCKKCGKELQYRIDHVYANDPIRKEFSFIVTRAVRLGTRLADEENYDPFLLVLREIETGKEQILPTFWAYGQSNTQRGGQFPPLLSLEEWKTLFRRLDASFDALKERIRLRAYLRAAWERRWSCLGRLAASGSGVDRAESSSGGCVNLRAAGESSCN
jgi:hypothetical protein